MTELWATQPSPEEVIRYAGRCLDSVLEMHGVIPPLDGPQVTPDDQGNYRVSYETQTLRVEATFTGTIRAGTIGVHRLETPHWKQGTPTSIDRFGGYDPAIPGKPQHLGRGTLAIELVTVPAISR